MTHIKWGILGCGHIAETFIAGLAGSPIGQLHGCAAREYAKAKAFASKHNIVKSYESYQALLADPDIDAIYVATTHNAHFDCVKASLIAGKHVLCEKPISINAALTNTLIELSKQHQRFLMEAVWTRFLPAIIALKTELKNGIIGDIRTVKADFSLCRELPVSHRLRDKNLAGGALLDLGIYPITMASIVFDKAPVKIASHAVMDSTGVDERSFYLFDYENGQSASLVAGYTHQSPCEAIICGSLGYIKVPFFLGAQSFEVFIEGQAPVIHKYPFEAHQNFHFEIEHAHECINKGLIESPLLAHKTSLEMMKTMDDLRAQWGLKYPFE